MTGIIILTICLTWGVIALVTLVTDDEGFATLPATLLYALWKTMMFPIDMLINKPVTKEYYERIKKCNFYKKRLSKNFHLVTLYGVAGNKEMPLYKRILSHVYFITYMKVKDEV